MTDPPKPLADSESDSESDVDFYFYFDFGPAEPDEAFWMAEPDDQP